MLERDWAYLEAATENLEEYLHSSILYYPLGNTKKVKGLLQLTLGNLLVTTKRLNAAQWNAEDLLRLAGFLSDIEDIHKSWRANWNKKTEQEVPARLSLWQNSLREWADHREHTLVGYRHQVRWRVILHLLISESGSHFREEQVLAGLDARLRMISNPGGFVWEPELEQGFSRQEYWYLYLNV
jgi:hypothetical protein